MTPRAVILFARSPEREAAAKRLRGGVPLFRALVAAWLRSAVDAGATPVIACAAEDREALAGIAPEVERVWLEQDRLRVAQAADAVFAAGATAVIVAAIDAPPSVPLETVFATIERGPAVVAPARDGGINFLGIHAPEPELLAQLTPRRRDLLRLCRQYLDDLVVVAGTVDVDSPSSLDAARSERAWRTFLTPRVLVPQAPETHPRSRPVRSVSGRAPPP